MVTDDLTTIFSDVARQLEPDLTAVVDGAAQRGRRMRARRRVAIAFSAGATVAAIAVGTTFGAQWAGRSAQGSQSTTHGKHRSFQPKPRHSQRPKHRPVAAPVPQEHGPGMTTSQMLAVLRPLLPAGSITYVDPDQSRGTVEINFDDGKGAVDIQMSATPTVRDSTDHATLHCPNPPLTDEGKRPVGALPISCKMTVLGNGEIIRRSVTEADFAGYYNFQIYLTRPDGVDVSIAVANGTLQGTPHEGRQYWPWVDRAVPPGSLDFWQAVVQNPKWHL